MERQQILDRLDSPGIAWSVSAFDIDSGAEVLSYEPGRALDTGCATELRGFVSRLARNELLDAAECDTLRRWQGAGVDCSMVASTFNFDPLAHDYYDRGLWLWNKTGTTSSVRADIGVLSKSESVVAYAVLANWERGSDHRDAAMDAMRDVGVLLRGHVQGSA